ncbi:MAG: phosphoglucomutase (alpha-D-glucose-1,6-bisphosphate-dependent) [Acidobacteriota bacterium]|nr:phosphoglucomutase (alpha-D-glucose-1,6-bisphosphate-dependent) [Acidobacteriota bacterium]
MPSIHALAGKPAPKDILIDVARLETEYYNVKPDPGDPNQLVSFGTSGHRGTPSNGTFTEAHILAITQAICDYRASRNTTGPIFMGKDTHALSAPAQRTALEVLAVNGIETFIARQDGATPTPVISRAILACNRGRTSGLGDGIVITPSHNPPSDGGFKYNPPDGGPADTDVTDWIQDRANALLRSGNADVKRLPFASAIKASTTHEHDFIQPYVKDIASVIDFEVIRSAGLNIGVDALGGASAAYWEPIAECFGLNISVFNATFDPTFAFMRLDHDGKIRMDCSSPYAMAGLVQLKERFDIAWANDPDSDRHGIVSPSEGLLNPNYYLAIAIGYLLRNRPAWNPSAVVGKTLVSSGLIDRVVASLGRTLWEVPVGFKWFAPRLFDGSCCFGGEESAGASFLRRDSSVWSTDKDGLILGLLAAEISARTGKDVGELNRELTANFGPSFYSRIDAPATPEQKNRLKKLSSLAVTASELAGAPVLAKMTRAPGNDEPIGGLKVVSKNGWFAARPSGTEDLYKLYAESFESQDHLERIVAEAQQIVTASL